jgi:co-chaperonin GroES (HSP10)
MGDISSVEVFNNQVLVAVYIRPQKTKSGIILTSQTTDEDRYQSKVGLVVKMGPQAFQDNSGQWFSGLEIKEGDWIVFRPSDGWSITVNNVLCRMIDDVNIKGRIDQPDRVW